MNETADKLISGIATVERANQNLLSKTKGDKIIWVTVLLLALISLLVVYSTTSSLAYQKNNSTTVYLFQQLSFIAVGLAGIYFLHRINYTIYSRIALILYLISVPLLIYTLLYGKEINGERRWIVILGQTIQTSDFAKLALFMYLARQLSRSQEMVKDLKKGYLPLIIPIIVTCALIMPANLSNALLTGMAAMLLLFIGRVNMKHFWVTIAIALVPLAFIVLIAVKTHSGNSDDASNRSSHEILQDLGSRSRFGTWVVRVQDFLYSKHEDVSFQVQQANIAIANGGILFGKGPGNSEQKNLLPQSYNDFVYSIIIEEYGLFGGIFVIVVYLIFLYRCISIFRRCPYAFGAFLALGLSFTMVIQALINMAVNVHIIPVTGVTLPLISKGGSAFLFTCASIGIILSVARNVEVIEGKAQPEGGRSEELGTRSEE